MPQDGLGRLGRAEQDQSGTPAQPVQRLRIAGCSCKASATLQHTNPLTLTPCCSENRWHDRQCPALASLNARGMGPGQRSLLQPRPAFAGRSANGKSFALDHGDGKHLHQTCLLGQFKAKLLSAIITARAEQHLMDWQ